jgi:hypothetical protein
VRRTLSMSFHFEYTDLHISSSCFEEKQRVLGALVTHSCRMMLSEGKMSLNYAVFNYMKKFLNTVCPINARH